MLADNRVPCASGSKPKNEATLRSDKIDGTVDWPLPDLRNPRCWAGSNKCRHCGATWISLHSGQNPVPPNDEFWSMTSLARPASSPAECRSR